MSDQVVNKKQAHPRSRLKLWLLALGLAGVVTVLYFALLHRGVLIRSYIAAVTNARTPEEERGAFTRINRSAGGLSRVLFDSTRGMASVSSTRMATS